MDLILHPEVARIVADNSTLRDELARACARIEYLLHVVKPHLLALYQVRLGAWDARVLALECELGRMRRRVSLLQAAHNLARPPDLAAIEATLDAEFLEWQARVNDAAARIQAAHHYLRAVMSDDDAAELKRLFHRLVRTLHPDVNPQQPAQHRVLWNRVMEAWSQGDLEALRAISTLLNGERTVGDAPDSIELLSRERTRLESDLASMVARIERLQSELPFSLQASLDDDAWVEARRSEADRRIEELTAQKAFVAQELRILLLAGHGAGSRPN